MSKYLTYNGETHSYKEWSEILGISKNTFYRRIKNGMEFEKAFNCNLYDRGIKKKKVKCLETDTIYNSIHECANSFYTCRSNLIRHLKGKQKTCCGYHFEYVEE